MEYTMKYIVFQTFELLLWFDISSKLILRILESEILEIQ